MLLLFSCNKNDDDTVPTNKLVEIANYSLNIKETSGLAFGPDKKTLLIVSDNTGKVYETDLKGNVLRILSYKGGDLEGVAYNEEDDEIAVVEERKREVVIIDYETETELRRFKIDVEETSNNSGLEGISWNTNNNCYYIVNEKKPSVLLVWNEFEGVISNQNISLGGDNSGIFVDSEYALLWILSDESESLYKCDYNGKKEKQYKVPINKPEGVVVDREDSLVYIVRDQFSKLFVYRIID
jgi:uncharacterized protein YjiK